MWWILAVASAQQVESKNTAWCFTSGLRVLFEPDHARPEVRFRMVVEGGSAAAKPGLAHLVEHLWFENTQDGQQVIDQLRNLGVRWGASTNLDYTTFETSGPRASARTLFALEARRLEGLLQGVTEQAFDVERNIVRNELRQTYSDTGRHVLHPFFKQLFPEGSPYHHLPIGSEASIASLTLQDARAYVDQVFVPSNTTLYVSGDLSASAFENLLVTTFSKDLLVSPDTDAVLGTCADRTSPVLPTAEPGPIATWTGSQRGRSSIAAWMFDPQDVVIAQFDLYLLEWKLRDTLDRDVGCGAFAVRRAGVAYCQFHLDDGEDPEKLMKRGLGVSQELWSPNNRDFLGKVYGRWRSTELGSLYRSLGNRRDELASQRFHQTGEQDWLQGELDRLSVDDFSVAASFGEQFKFKGAHLAVIEAPTDDLASRPAFHGSRDVLAPDDLDSSAERLKRILSEPNWALLTQTQLANGMTLTVFPHGTVQNLVRVAVVFPGRTDPALDLLTWRSLPAVTLDDKDAARDLLGHWNESRYGDRWVFGLDGIDLDAQLKLLRTHIEGQRPGTVIRRLDLDDLPDPTLHEHAWRKRERRLQPDVPLGWAEYAERFKELAPKQARQWATARLRPEGAHVIVVGTVNPLAVQNAVEKAFGSWRGDREPRMIAAPAPVLPDPVMFAYGARSEQSSVALSCRLATDSTTVAGLTASLVERALWDVLRDREGLTYGMHAIVVSDEMGLRLEIRGQVEGARTLRALQVIQEQLNTSASTVPSPALLSRARIQEASQWAQGLGDGGVLLHLLMAGAGTPRPVTAKASLATDLANVTGPQISAALAACAGHEVVSVVGPPDGLKDLDELGIPVERPALTAP